MARLRLALLAAVSLGAASSDFLAAEEPEAGKVRLLRTLQEPTGRVFTVSFSADGRRLLTAGGKVIRLWDTANGMELAKYERGGETAGHGVLSPDGKILAAQFCVSPPDILLLDAESGKTIQRIAIPNNLRWFAFAPDGRTLLYASDDRAFHLWEVATGKEIRRMPFLDAERREWVPNTEPGSFDVGWSVYGAFAPDGMRFAGALGDGSIWLYDAGTGTAGKRLFHAVAGDKHVAFSPDGKLLASGSPYQDFIQIWDPTSGELVRELRLGCGGLMERDADRYSLPLRGPFSTWSSFSSDGKSLAICCADDCVRLFEVATGQLRYRFTCKGFLWGSLAPSGHLLVTADLKGGVQLWDWREPCLEYPARLEEADIERLWTELAGEDAAIAYKAVAALIAARQHGVTALSQRLKPLAPVTKAEINRLVGELNDDDFSVREAASRRLAELGELGRTALERALANEPSREVKNRCERLLAHMTIAPAPETLRRLRAVEVLETVGTDDAKRVLGKLADGAAGGVETEDARAALKRLEKR